MTYGVTINGFVRPRLVDIKTQIEKTISDIFGKQINTLPQALIEQWIGAFAEREDLVWQAMEDVYNSQYPDLASGVSLDNAAALTGAVRLQALASKQLSEYLFGDVGMLIPAGTQIAVNGSLTSLFQTDNDVTLVAGLNEIQEILFDSIPTSGSFKLNFMGGITAAIPFSANAAAIQAAIRAASPFAAGVVVTGAAPSFTVEFDGDSGLQDQDLLVVSDNTLANIGGAVSASIQQNQAGIPQGTVNMTALATGPTVAPAGTLIVIMTPVAGLSRVVNKHDASAGRNLESDNAFKARRLEELQAAGKATINAIISGLTQLAGVTDVIVFENITMVTDANGLPAKSIEAIVTGGDDQAIADALFGLKAGGIRAFGTITKTVVDSRGQSHSISFSRPTEVPIYVIAHVYKNTSFPATGVALCQEAIVEKGNALGAGKEVIVIPYLISALVGIAGIEDVELLVGKVNPPTTSDNVAIDPEEISRFDTTRVSVVLHNV